MSREEMNRKNTNSTVGKKVELCDCNIHKTPGFVSFGVGLMPKTKTISNFRID